MNMKDFDRACELLPEGVTWGEAITPSIVKHIAEAAQAQQPTELSDRCKVAASCLTYNDTEKEAVAKHLLLEASQELRRAQAQQESQEIGEMRENGVNWYGKNPHAFALGTKFFALPPAPEGDKE